MTFIDFDTIDGLRKELHDKTFETAKENAAKTVPAELLAAYIEAAGL